jgi:hypothetical protein
MPRHKRPRGGQPGNQNARKHGFYAGNRTPEEIKKFIAAIDADDKDPAWTAISLKVQNAVANSPGNYRVIREGSSLLVKYLCAKNNFPPEVSTLLKRAFRNTCKAAAAGNLNLTERIASELLKDAEKLQNNRGYYPHER